MQAIGSFFGRVMYFCYQIVHNYGLAIILFTLITKVILLPISVMVQKNSIKMVKMYPQINRIKAKYYGNKDMISEEQYQLYKKEQYHPTLDLLPVFLQLVNTRPACANDTIPPASRTVASMAPVFVQLLI